MDKGLFTTQEIYLVAVSIDLASNPKNLEQLRKCVGDWGMEAIEGEIE
jgi:hypothetical protein